MRVFSAAFGLFVACTPTEDPEPASLPEPEPIDLADVDPFVGGGGRGFGTGSTYPGPALPFALAHPGPDTQGESSTLGALHCSGYRREDEYIGAFSHLRMHGTGVPDYGILGLMPAVDWVDGQTGAPRLPKGEEEAHPGYYRVDLPASPAAVRVELTSTLHAALHRVTFPMGAARRGLAIDLRHALPDVTVLEAELGPTDGSTLTGRVRFDGPMTGTEDLWFTLQTEPTWTAATGWDALDGGPGGVFLEFGGAGVVAVRVGLSMVDAEGASNNLENELPTFDFNGTRAAAEAVWRETLAPLAIAAPAGEERRVFASAAYHSFLMPTSLSDHDGRWVDFAGELHDDEGFTFLTDLSLWDTYRTQHALFDLVAPDVQSSILRSLLEMHRDLGAVPRWPIAHHESGTMVGDPAAMLFASSFHAGVGLDLVDPAEVLQALLTTADQRGGRASMDTHHHLTIEDGGGTVSRTQEYAWADRAIAEVASFVGEPAIAADLLDRSTWYRTMWDPEERFFRARFADGSFRTTLDPTNVFDEDYVEGDAWHYAWLAPHDAAGLIEQFGGAEPFVAKLSVFFEEAAGLEDTFLPDPYYWHGNEPDLHAAWLFALAGRPDLSRRWVAWVADQKYALDAEGLDGNDDAGTLSAWYLWASVGLYPIAGTTEWILNPPRFPVVRVGPITAWNEGCTPESPTVTLTVNGEAWTAPTLNTATILGGVDLIWSCD